MGEMVHLLNSLHPSSMNQAGKYPDSEPLRAARPLLNSVGSPGTYVRSSEVRVSGASSYSPSAAGISQTCAGAYPTLLPPQRIEPFPSSTDQHVEMLIKRN